MDFLTSEWFTWVIVAIVASSVITIFWTSFVEESDTEWKDVVRVTLKVILFVPMLVLGGLLIAIEKKYWGALVFAVIVIAMFVIAYIKDPGGTPAPWQ